MEVPEEAVDRLDGAYCNDRRQLMDVIAAALCAQEEALDADDDGGTWRGWSTDDVAEMLASAVQAAPRAGSAVPVATPRGRTAHDATVAAQALMGVVSEIDDLEAAELVTRRAMQFEQEAQDLASMPATPAEPMDEVVCPNCKARIRARMSDVPDNREALMADLGELLDEDDATSVADLLWRHGYLTKLAEQDGQR